MFGDYYWFYQSYRDHLTSGDPTPVRGLHGFWFRRIYLTYDYASARSSDALSPRSEQ